MKRLNFNRKNLYIILCIVLISVFSLSIAYAALSVTLNITGTAQVMDASWDVHFANVKVNPASVPITPQILNNQITFNANLEEPGDFYKFTVDIVNDGSIDAMIDTIITTPNLTTEQKKYLKFEIEYADGQSINTKQKLNSKETKTISVLFSFRTDIPVSDLPTTSSNFNVGMTLVYYQADDTSTSIETGASKVNIVSGDMDTVGSEICIQEECFYVISSDNYSVTMLAKYNLYVGGYYDGSVWTEYVEGTTGIQNSNMIGHIKSGQPANGATPFSNTTHKGDQLSDYKGSIVEGYVNDYYNYLHTLKVIPTEARLITYYELIDLGCSIESNKCSDAPSWVYSTSYWTGSAKNSIQIILVSSEAIFSHAQFNDNRGLGVRPVITISKTEF